MLLISSKSFINFVPYFLKGVWDGDTDYSQFKLLRLKYTLNVVNFNFIDAFCEEFYWHSDFSLKF